MSRDRSIPYENIPDTLDFNKIKVGIKNLDDAILELGSIKGTFPKLPYGDKKLIYRAIAEKDYALLREISNFFYGASGIYERVCNYFAFLYRYDWYIVPEIFDNDQKNTSKILKDFSKVLNYLDNSHIKKVCGDIALQVIKNGCYYGYIVDNKDGVVLQELPPNYCRSRYSVAGMPAVEFNMKFFDTFKDINYRMKVLNLFPDEFKEGYMLYKKNKLTQDDFTTISSSGRWNVRREPLRDGWYLLEPLNCVKFNFNGNDTPLFVSAIPSIIDLDAAQDLDRRKQMQKLLKIIVQKLPMDKNNDLIFDIDEAKDIHNNAVEMLSRAVGVDVLTTFADIDSIDMSDKNTATTRDDLEKVERTVFNDLGISRNLFNTDGNLSLEKSILNDEASMYNLVQQFEQFLNILIKDFNKSPKKIYYKVQILGTTIYNYKDLSKLYKEQTQLGYSKMLPQIALGQSQSSILATAHFENDILDLVSTFIPPMQSSTMNADVIKQRNGDNSENKNNGNNASDNGNGRPTKESQGEAVTEKTMQNRESAK